MPEDRIRSPDPGSSQLALDWHLLSLLLIVVIVGFIGAVPLPLLRLWIWLAVLFLLALFAIVAGHGITGMWHGLLIGPRNTFSLSRLQLLLWTLVILSGLLGSALTNIRAHQPEPLHIAVPVELWLLMGISTTASIGAPMLMNRASEVNKAHEPGSEGSKSNSNEILINSQPSEAHWTDLFRGDRAGTAGQLDLNKLQMFFFTLILVLAYAATLAGSFLETTGKIQSLPGLDPGMMVLLGISHAGFLANKVVSPSPRSNGEGGS